MYGRYGYFGVCSGSDGAQGEALGAANQRRCHLCHHCRTPDRDSGTLVTRMSEGSNPAQVCEQPSDIRYSAKAKDVENFMIPEDYKTHSLAS